MCIIRYYWLIALYIFISLVRIASFLIVKTLVSGKNSVIPFFLMTQFQQTTVKEHIFCEFALTTITFGSCTSPTDTFPFTYLFLSVPISIQYPLNCWNILLVNYFQRFQRQICIFNNPDWRRCSHFRIPFTLQSLGDFPRCWVTEAHIPFW